MLHVLVDYENLLPVFKTNSLDYLTNSLFSILKLENETFQRVLIRLYGGWYEEENFTRKAQSLSAQIDELFPKIYSFVNSPHKIVCNVELSFSLISNPYNHLFHTYRPRAIFYNLKTKPLADIGCAEPDCPLAVIENFIKNSNCPKCNKVKPENFFYKGEQKLVDTMLTSDMIYLCQKKFPVAIASSDDDCWPGIFTAITLGGKITHIITRDHQNTHDHYCRYASNSYQRLNLNP